MLFLLFFYLLGYLKEEGCTAAYATFLEECRHLSEYAQLLHAGREYSTKVGGLSLKEIANGYSHLSAGIFFLLYIYMLLW